MKAKGEEDEMLRQHHWFNAHAFEQTLGDSRGHRNLVCCTVHGVTKSGHMAEQLQQPFVDTIDTAESDGNFIS